MKGDIYRITYNVLKSVAEIHFLNGNIKRISMTQEEWDNALKGDLIENFKKYLDE